MSEEHQLRQIANELRLIRKAMERMSPPPPKDQKPESVYEKRGIICF